MWQKSTHSNSQGNCVEVRKDEHRVLVRDSKNPNGPTLIFTYPEWDAFVKGVKDGEFDRSQ